MRLGQRVVGEPAIVRHEQLELPAHERVDEPCVVGDQRPNHGHPRDEDAERLKPNFHPA